MFTLFRSMNARQLLLNQAPSLLGSLLIAQMFYKFGAFLPEVLAFLATWFVIDFVTSLLFKTTVKE